MLNLPGLAAPADKSCERTEAAEQEGLEGVREEQMGAPGQGLRLPETRHGGCSGTAAAEEGPCRPDPRLGSLSGPVMELMGSFSALLL